MLREDTRTKTILAANPSFEHAVEEDFWMTLHAAVARHGWRVLFHAMRKVPLPADGMRLPARLTAVADYLSALPFDKGTQLPAWLSPADFDRIVDWEYRRWGYNHHEPRIATGLRKLAWHVDRMFNACRPAACMTSNKIDHGCELFFLAAQHNGSMYNFVERSPLDSMLVEPTGMFAESDIFQGWAEREAKFSAAFLTAIGGKEAERLQESVEGFRVQNPLSLDDHRMIAALPRPLVLLPMDNVLWTGLAQPGHPQQMIDYPPDFRNPSEFVRTVAGLVAEAGGSVLLKLHPAERQQGFEAHAQLPNVRVFSKGLKGLLAESDACVTLLSKVAFPAIFTGLPTAVLSTNPASLCAPSTRFTSDQDLRTVLAGVLKSTDQPGSRREVKPDQYRALGRLFMEWYVDTRRPFSFFRRNPVSVAETVIHKATEQGPLIDAAPAVWRWRSILARRNSESIGVWDDEIRFA